MGGHARRKAAGSIDEEELDRACPKLRREYALCVKACASEKGSTVDVAEAGVGVEENSGGLVVLRW